MKIKILGSGCSGCLQLEKNTLLAVKELGINASIEKVTDIKNIISYGIMSFPAIVIDEKVVMYGQVLGVKDLVQLIKENIK